jgi:zinc D-Ala-D-Ala carboxypeptidase
MIFKRTFRRLNLQILNLLFGVVCLSLLFSCVIKKNNVIDESSQNIEQEEEVEEEVVIEEEEEEEEEEADAMTLDLLKILEGDPYLYILVDKNNSIGEYVPEDLVTLKSVNYKSVPGMRLRAAAADSLEEMAVAARKSRLKLIVSSSYRSHYYQTNVYTRAVKRFGKKQADRTSAQSGHSQHQLGLVVDFYPIANSFAKSAEGIWVKANASKFGWSISYPYGYEELTGYSWESWHYRYVGRELAEFIDKYFDGIQQNALVFIHEWEKKRTF